MLTRDVLKIKNIKPITDKKIIDVKNGYLIVKNLEKGCEEVLDIKANFITKSPCGSYLKKIKNNVFLFECGNDYTLKFIDNKLESGYLKDAHFIKNGVLIRNTYAEIYKLLDYNGYTLMYSIKRYTEDGSLIAVKDFNFFGDFIEIYETENLVKLATIKDVTDIKSFKNGFVIKNSNNHCTVLIYENDVLRRLKFKVDSVDVITNNKFLLTTYTSKGNSYKLVDSKNKELCSISKDFLYCNKYDGLETITLIDRAKKKSAFINNDNKMINLDCEYFKVIDDSLILITKKDKMYLVNKEGKIISDIYDIIEYNSDYKLFVVKKGKKEGIIDINLNQILPLKYFRVKIVNDNYFIVCDEENNNYKTRLINRKQDTIYTSKENENINNYNIKIKDKLVVISSDLGNSLYSESGKELIPTINQEIIIYDKNQVIVDNYLINLKDKLNDMEISYEVFMHIFNIDKTYSFDSEEKRELFIKEVEKLNEEYLNSLKSIGEDVKVKKKEYDYKNKKWI